MNAHEAIKAAYVVPSMVWKMYVDDLTDEEMLVRPVPGANHIKWQIGHLIVSQAGLVESVCPGQMAPLPAGFAERYTKDAAGSDDPAAFDSKADLLRIADEQHASVMAVLDSVSETDLEKPSPEQFRRFGPTVAHIFTMIPAHWTVHAGQWAVIRRKLGRPPLF